MWVLGITLLGLIKRSSASVREDLFAVGGVSAVSAMHYSRGGGSGRSAIFFKIVMVTLLYLVACLSLSFYHCII